MADPPAGEAAGTSSPAPQTALKRLQAKATQPKPKPKTSAAPAAESSTPPSPSTPSKPTGKAAPAGPSKPSATVVDASGLVLGRAASLIAQRLLRGESIVVVNAERSVVTGSRDNILAFYRANRARGSKRTGPHYPRYPDRIFRRTVRGMLPHLKSRGKEAFERLEVHIGIPSELTGASRQSLEVAKARPALRAPMTLAEVSRLLGARV